MFWKVEDEKMINGLKVQCKSILPLLGGGGPKQGEDEEKSKLNVKISILKMVLKKP